MASPDVNVELLDTTFIEIEINSSAPPLYPHIVNKKGVNAIMLAANCRPLLHAAIRGNVSAAQIMLKKLDEDGQLFLCKYQPTTLGWALDVLDDRMEK